MNEKRVIKCNTILWLTGWLFSRTINNSVLIVQINVIINIFIYGCSLKWKGYKIDIIPKKNLYNHIIGYQLYTVKPFLNPKFLFNLECVAVSSMLVDLDYLILVKKYFTKNKLNNTVLLCPKGNKYHENMLKKFQNTLLSNQILFWKTDNGKILVNKNDF